jgi:hypothetical protein
VIRIAANIEFEVDEAAVEEKVDDDEEWSIVEVAEKVENDEEEWSVIGDEEAAVEEKVENDEEEWSIIEDVSLAGEDYIFLDASLATTKVSLVVFTEMFPTLTLCDAGIGFSADVTAEVVNTEND